MNLAILLDLETWVLFVVQSLTCHDRSWADSFGYPALRRKMIQQLQGMKNDADHQKLWDPGEGEDVSCSPGGAFLYHPNSSLDFRDVPVAACQFDSRSARHSLD
jgi:hypothetical protein